MNNQQTIRGLTVLLNSYRKELDVTYDDAEYYRRQLNENSNTPNLLVKFKVSLSRALQNIDYLQTAIQATEEQIEALSADLG